MQFLYFDTAIGAMIIHAIVAAIAGIILFSKNALYKVKVFLGIAKPLRDQDLFDDIDIDDTELEKNKTIEDK